MAISNRFTVLNPDTGDEGSDVGAETQDLVVLKFLALVVYEASMGVVWGSGPGVLFGSCASWDRHLGDGHQS